MADSHLPPVCKAPSCREEATLRFMQITPLCARHGAKANRRAAINVLVIGALFAVVGVLLMLVGNLAHPAVGAVVFGCGVIVAGLSPIYRRSARKLEG